MKLLLTLIACLLLLLLLALLAGCGSGDETSTSASPADNRYFRDNLGQEETNAAISKGACRALRQATEAKTGGTLRTESEPSPPSSRCLLRGHGDSVSIYLDAAFAARQRYFNRMVEQDQFYGTDPAKHPHPVPGVGDPGAYGHTASWIPALSSIYAVRGNRWVTVFYSVAGASTRERREAAADLARQTFRLTAR